jgi:hypothetical protein
MLLIEPLRWKSAYARPVTAPSVTGHIVSSGMHNDRKGGQYGDLYDFVQFHTEWY